jgi:hypothetical protein
MFEADGWSFTDEVASSQRQPRFGPHIAGTPDMQEDDHPGACHTDPDRALAERGTPDARREQEESSRYSNAEQRRDWGLQLPKRCGVTLETGSTTPWHLGTRVDRRPLGSVAAWLVVLVLPGSAWAQVARQVVAAPTPAVVTIAPAQLESFVAVVGDAEADVAQTLFNHPDLIPVAAAAADARAGRKHTGAVLTVAGFSVLGVGLVGALATTLSAPIMCFDEQCRQRQEGASTAGEAIAIGAAAIGLVLAIPGFVKMIAQTDTENEALRRYRAVRPEAALPPLREPVRANAWGSAPRASGLVFAF